MNRIIIKTTREREKYRIPRQTIILFQSILTGVCKKSIKIPSQKKERKKKKEREEMRSIVLFITKENSISLAI